MVLATPPSNFHLQSLLQQVRQQRIFIVVDKGDKVLKPINFMVYWESDLLFKLLKIKVGTKPYITG